MEQLAGMSKSKGEKIQNKNHPTARHPQLGLESQQGAGACLLTNFRFDYLENNRKIMTHQNGGVGDVMKSQLQSCRPHLSIYEHPGHFHGRIVYL